MSLERILKEPGSERERGAPRWVGPGPAAIRPWPFIIALFLGLALQLAHGQDTPLNSPLPRTRFRSGDETLRAFASVSHMTRHSIVKLHVDGETVALGMVMDANGLVLTKASEIKKGKLTCWLASDKEVDAQLEAVDDTEDMALVRVQCRNLKPIQWASDEVAVGQWAITPGIALTPHAVGIISALPHRIRPPRAYIGVVFDRNVSIPRIGDVRPGFGAEKAGLKIGDVFLALNGAAVTNREQVVETLRELREGTKIKLHVQRAEEELDAEVEMKLPSAVLNGNDFFPEERESRLAGNTSKRAEGFEQAIEHDTVLQPWLCGGPLVNLDGQVIGLNIARASRVTTYALPAALVKRIFEQLKTAPASSAISGG